MKKVNILIFALAIIISILALSLYLKKTPQPAEPPTTSPKVLPEPAKQPIVHYPVPKVETATEQPAEQPSALPDAAPQNLQLPAVLPPIEESDESIKTALTSLNLNENLLALLLSDNLIQRIVTMVDNLPEKRLPKTHLPIISPKGRFIVSGTAEEPQTSSRNHARYQKHVELLKSIDPDLAIEIYVYFYPLFQEAYAQLGYKNAYFNDRLVYAIEHLLETPNPPEPLLLDQPAVLYIYKDPVFENLSAGQKTLLRIGPDFRQEVISILKKYKDKLVTLRP